MRSISRIKQIVQRVSCAVIAGAYAPVMMAAGDWFPKVSAKDDLTAGNKTSMDALSRYVLDGGTLLLLLASLGTFIKFISTVSHGIEESKKNESGSLATFGTYTVMASIYLGISILSGYMGYSMITKFHL